MRFTILISAVLLSGCVSTVPTQDEPQSVIDAKRVFSEVLALSQSQLQRIENCESMRVAGQWGWAENCIEANNHANELVIKGLEFNKAKGRLIDWGVTNLNDSRLLRSERMAIASDLERFMDEAEYYFDKASLKRELMSVPNCFNGLTTRPLTYVPQKGCCDDFNTELPASLAEPLCRIVARMKE